MTKEERLALILELLMQHDSILVTDLATHLNVSSVTIRKDLTDLEREKKLYRNHGKAILIDPYIDNRNVSEKEKLYVEEKRLIGMKAANLIAPKDSILIASGTTMQHSSGRRADRHHRFHGGLKHLGKREKHMHHPAWRNSTAQQPLRCGEICGKHTGRLLVQQIIHRCGRH